jgi:hypothetical protein
MIPVMELPTVSTPRRRSVDADVDMMKKVFRTREGDIE